MAPDNDPMDELTETLLSIPAAWYPDHADLERCLVQAKESFKGPTIPMAVAIYTTLHLDRMEIQPVVEARLGRFYLNAIEYSMSCSLSTLFDPTARNEYQVMPVLIEFLHHMVMTSIETDLPEVYALCHAFFHDLVDHPNMPDEMVAMMRPLHDIVSFLDERGMPSEVDHAARKEFLDLLDAAVAPFMVTYGELPQSHPAVEDVAPALPPVAASVTTAVLPSETPMVTPHTTPGTVSQVDGSIGIDSHLDLVRLFMPRRSAFSSSSAQWDDTLAQFSGATLELLDLWRRVHSSCLEGQKQNEARLMDSVGRLMEYLFTQEQLALLAKRLPMEQVMDNMLSFVSGSLNKPPHLSIPQMRISLVSAAIIAVTTQENLFKEAEALWRDLGLDSDIHLLLTTLSTHADALQERIVKVVPPKHTFTLQ